MGFKDTPAISPGAISDGGHLTSDVKYVTIRVI